MKKPFAIALLFLFSGIGLSLLFLPERQKGELKISHYTENKKMQVRWDEQLYVQLAEGEQLAYSADGINWIVARDHRLPEVIPAVGKPSLSSVPTSFRWKAPVWDLPKASALRCIVFHEANKERSPIAFYTKLSQKHQVKVLSLFVDPDDFFSDERGVYVVGKGMYDYSNNRFTIPWWERPANYHQRGRAWERRAHVQLLDEKGELEYESDAGVRIHGNATRAYPQKSLRLTARKEYGNGKFRHPFFGEASLPAYDDLILRNGGNDWDRTMIADEFIHRVFAEWPERNVELICQRYVPVELFINGEYWGLHNLRERINADYFSQRFSVSKKDVVIAEGDKVVHGNESDQKDWDELVAFCKTKDLFQQENYNYVSQRLNVPSFIVYLVTELYAANTDWPLNNVKCFRIRDKHVDSSWMKWNFVLWDMDYAMAYTGKSAFETDMLKRLDNSRAVPAVFFRALYKNPAFYTEFLTAIDLGEERFAEENMLENMREMSARIQPVMSSHIKRWRKPASLDDWHTNLESNRDFIRKRRQYMRKLTKSYVSSKSIESTHPRIK